MFEAYVLVCMIGNSNICHTLKDLEGPYKTKQECIVRTYEMAADLPDYMPMFQALKYKCFEDKESDKMRINYGNKNTQRHDEGSHDKWRSKTTH